MKRILLTLILAWVGIYGSSQLHAQGADPLVQQGSKIYKIRTQAEFAAMEGKLNAQGKQSLARARQELAATKGAKFTVGANEILNMNPKSLLGLARPQAPNPNLIRQMEESNKKLQQTLAEDLKKQNIQLSFTYVDLSSINLQQLLFGRGCTWNTSILTPVKEQSPCGSCWAFAAAATWEHTYRNFYGTSVTPDLSEEDLLNCGVTTTGADAGDCVGGYTDRAMNYIVSKKVASEADYPYTGTIASCVVSPKTYGAYYYGQLYPGRFPTVDEVKAYVYLYGAVTSYMKAGLSSFFGYSGGVYNGYPSNAANELDHAVTIVGWCDDKNAWIIKNSWGTDWGPYGGYAYVDYNSCNIGKNIYYIYPRR